MWFIGVEVEQETSAPPPKKNPGSAPALLPCYLIVALLPRYSVTLLLCYLLTLSPVTLLPCYPFTLLLCYPVTLLPCYPVIVLFCYVIILLICYFFSCFPGVGQIYSS